MDVKKSYYASVSASSTDTSSYVIPDGKQVNIRCAGGNAVFSSQVKVEILFDGTVLFCTHGDGRVELDQVLVGNGVKSIDIKITNDSAAAETCGGHWQGKEY